MSIDLWKKSSKYWEQPDVLFRNEILLQVLDDDGVSWQYSTNRELNEQSMNPLSMPIIKFSQSDFDKNGKIDEFRLSLKFKGDPSKVRQV